MSNEEKPPDKPNDPLRGRNIFDGVLIGVIVVVVTLPVVIIAGAASNLIAKDPPILTFTSAPTPTAVATTERVVIVTATSDVRAIDTATVPPSPSPIPPTPTNELPTPILQPTELPKPISTQPPTTIPVVPTDLPSPMPPPVGGIFADLWLRHKDDLGAPLPENQSDRSFPAYTFGEMPFERGHMFLYKDGQTSRIWVVYGSGQGAWTGDGEWAEYTSAWREGDPEDTCSPQSSFHPKYEFGDVWCRNKVVQDRLGNGINTARDWDRDSPGTKFYRLQEFEKGFIFRDSDGRTHRLAYIFFNDNTFVREKY